MKKKNGFTLVELLAVIAILAILVVMLVPNFVDMFKESKSSIFVTEVQTIMKQAQEKWLLDGGVAKTYRTQDFKLDGDASKFYYTIAMDMSGKFTSVTVCSPDNCLTETNVKIADLKSEDVKSKTGAPTEYSTIANKFKNSSYPSEANAMKDLCEGKTQCDYK